MVKESIIRFIKEQIYGVQGLNSFSAGFDETKLVKGVRLSEQNQNIFLVAPIQIILSLSKNQAWRKWRKLTDLKLEKNGAEVAFEIKIIVLTLKRV